MRCLRLGFSTLSLLMLCLFFQIAHPTQARATASEEEEEEEEDDDDDRRASVTQHCDTSKCNRAGQTVFFGLGSRGLSFGLKLESDRILEVAWSNAPQDSRSHEDDSADERKERIGSVWERRGELRLMNFHGNSSYTSYGLTSKQSGTWAETGPERANRATIFASFALGNLWSWSVVNFGVDWVTLHVPLFDMKRVAHAGTTRSENRGMRSSLQNVQLEVLNLHLGVAF